MPAKQPTIIATSIDFRSLRLGEWDWRAGPMYSYAAGLAQAGPPSVEQDFVSRIALTPQPNTADIRALLLAQDVIWVAGGSVANLLARA